MTKQRAAVVILRHPSTLRQAQSSGHESQGALCPYGHDVAMADEQTHRSAPTEDNYCHREERSDVAISSLMSEIAAVVTLRHPSTLRQAQSSGHESQGALCPYGHDVAMAGRHTGLPLPEIIIVIARSVRRGKPPPAVIARSVRRGDLFLDE